MLPIILIALFVIAILFNVYGSLSGKLFYIRIFKPLLMPVLVILHLFTSQTINPLLIGGLFFGWMGDIFLIKPEGKRFLFGLVSFLTGHILYIVLLAGRINGSCGISVQGDSLLLLPYLLFGVVLFLFLRNDLGEMTIPVIIYMLCLIAMSYSALLFKNCSNGLNFYLPFAGSLFFLLSDTLLAISLFKGEKRFSYSAVIITYGAAQFLITIGFSL